MENEVSSILGGDLGPYKIIAPLGEGGMGEVYRAHDPKLDRDIAIKVLRQELVADPDRLNRFEREARSASALNHPNIVHIYEIDTENVTPYIAMEFVEGKTLREILLGGPLRMRKLIQLSSQVAAGLAKAHAAGIVHRDLKPENLMVTKDGFLKILDFGLAKLMPEALRETATNLTTAERTKSGVLLGTMSYMSPEQATGRAVDHRSDQFALGMILYEMVMGKHPFLRGTGIQTLAAIIEDEPAPLSSLNPDVPSHLALIVERCLEKDPEERYDSTRDLARELKGLDATARGNVEVKHGEAGRRAPAVSAALPGGDALAAAVAAGKTPAPELVAESIEEGAFRPAVAWVCLAAVLVLLPLIFWMSSLTRLTQVVALPISPEFLAADAREILATLGYPDPPRDTTYGFSRHPGYIDHLMEGERSAEWLDLLRRGEPSVIRFWYRESPDYLIPRRTAEFLPTENDPPSTLPGMVDLQLDTRGRLRRFKAVSPERDNVQGSAKADWLPLLRAAGFDSEALTEVEPQWLPSTYVTERAAFTGAFPDAPEVPARIEAGALHGRPVWFRVIEPWTQPAEVAQGESPFIRPSDIAISNVARLAHISFNLLLIVVLALFARRNLRLGRSDRKSAFRLALFLFALQMVRWLLGAHHVPERSEADIVFGGLYRAFFTLSLVWLFYVALEPYARRLWPETMVSWVRLLNGRFRDPRVGRDVLLGCLLGTLMSAWILQISALWPGWLGDVPPRPDLPVHASELLALQGVSISFSQLFAVGVNAMNTSLFIIVGFLLLRFLLRRTWAAVAVALGLMTLVWSSGWPYLGWLSQPVAWALWFFFLFRFGWVTVVIGVFVCDLLQSYPLTVDALAWYAHPTYLVTSVVVLLTFYGFRVSLGGRPAFGDLLAEE